MKRTASSLTFSIAAAAAILLISNAAAAQEPGGRGGTPAWPPAGPASRTADGHPDLSGNWQPNAIRQNVDLVGSGVDVFRHPSPRDFRDSPIHLFSNFDEGERAGESKAGF